ncbi:glycosyltransferase family 2 protein [Psychroflexus salis]|uniref:Glycosyl transferase family 2 n=1 Tax=Psychroflexus salis TaxID=1526574 RepID=A0A916ZWV8_9FLAO|nr:glycosyltransferase family 2 protein [Psychroflexus salis]GGE17315.1 glycosyl transferase family 2 [Psychroflexus salis]
MKIAILILNWNGKKLLKEFLPSIVKYAKNSASIYVVDNASTDDSVLFLQNEFPDVKVLQLSQNFGYAEGYNRALQQIDEAYAILLNNDVAFKSDVATPLLNLFETNQQISAIQPKILDYKKPDYFEYAGAAGGFIDWFAYPYCRGRVFSAIEKDQGQYNDEIPIFWASGACLGIRVKHFQEAGGFDQDYFAHMEEIDLCWRLQNLGYKIFYTHQAEVFHFGGGTLHNQNPQKTFLNFRNSLFNLLKNAPSKNIYAKLIARMLLDGIAAIFFLCKLQFFHFMAVLKAHFSFYTHFNKMKQKRKTNPNSPRYYTRFSVVLSKYFS